MNDNSREIHVNVSAYFAAEEVTVANNSLTAKLLSSNHVQPLILPRSQVEALQMIKQNKKQTL